jgi:hypothetical protein
MASPGDVVITLRLKDLISQEAQAAASKTQSAFSSMQSAASKMASGTVGAIQGLVGGVKGYFDNLVAHFKWASAIVGGFLVKEVSDAIDMASKFERFSIAAEALTGSKKAADEFASSVRQLTRDTMFNIDQIAEMESRLIGNTKDVGLSARALRDLSVAVQATGGDYSELESSVRAWIQTNSKASASSEELNRQFANANIPMLRMLAENIVQNADNPLRKYIETAGGAVGVSKTLTTAYQGASEKMGVLGMKVQQAEAAQKEYLETGKKSESQTLSHKIAVENAKIALDKAKGSIDKYNVALKNSNNTGKVAELTVKDVLAQLQNLGDLKIPGDVMAEAMLQAIEANKGFQDAFVKTRTTVAFQMNLIRDNIKMVVLSLMGLDENFRTTDTGIMRMIANALIPLNDWLEKNTSKIQEFSKWLGQNRDVAIFLASAIVGILYPAFMGLVAPLIGAAIVFGGLGFIIAKLIDKFIGFDNVTKAIKTFFENIPGIIETADNKLRSFIGNILGVQGKKMNWELGLEMSAPPSWENIATGFDQKVVQPMKQKIQDLKDAFVFGDITSPIPATWEEVAKKYLDIISRIGIFLSTTMKPVTDAWAESMKQLGPALQILLPMLGQVLVVILSLGGAILTGLLAALAPLLTGIVQIFTGILSFLTGFFQLVIGLFTLNGQMISDGWSALWTGIVLMFDGFKNLVFNTAAAFVSGFIGFFTGLAKALIGDGDASTFGKMFLDIVDGITKWKKNVDDINGKIIASITKMFTDMVESASSWGSNLISNFVNGVISKAKEAAKKGFLGPLGSLGAGALEQISAMHFQHGGVVPGSSGEAVPIVAHAGERVVPRAGIDQKGFGQTAVNINISGTFNLDDSARVNELARSISRIYGRQLELAQLGAGY